MNLTPPNPKSAAGADIRCELKMLLASQIEISAFFLLSQPNPDPALSVIVEEPDPSLLEG
jgi:hypothetical protein